MADLQRMDRTWLCSVLFMDIVKYSSQSVDMQMKWKARFNGYLAEAIRDVPESERVILDTGDGAAVCFLGAPEAAMFAALHLWQCFVSDAREQQPGLRVRIGVNLGPVKLVKDLNGSLNAIGDGINAGQRIMSFAQENQILVSQSFFEVVSRLSDDYKVLFKLKGVETDKHVREHTVYSLLPPGSEKWHAEAAGAGQPGKSQPEPVSRQTAAAPASPVVAASEARPHRRSPVPLLVGGALVMMVGAVVAWHFAGSGRTKASLSPANVPAADAPASQSVTAPSAMSSMSNASTKSAVEGKTPQRAAVPSNPPASQPDAPVARKNENAFLAAQPAEGKVPTEAQTAYDQGMQLIDQAKPAEAVQRFDDAIRANPDYVIAYLGRAEARRMLSQYGKGIEDCNAAMRIKPQEPRAYFCRGLNEGLLNQYDLAARDYGEAIRLNPNFALAYDNRGNCYNNLHQYDRALEDYNQAIRLRPNIAQTYLRRAVTFENLKQYERAIEDYDQAIRLQPNNARAYFGRANAKHLSGDRRGAAADRRYAKQLKEQ